jgi:hypothetical protein
MTRRDKRTGAYAEVSGRAEAHRADMRDRMRQLRADRARKANAPVFRQTAPEPRPVPDLPPVQPLAVLPVEDHALIWVRPPTEGDRELLGRMLARAEADGRVQAAASIRQRIASLGEP